MNSDQSGKSRFDLSGAKSHFLHSRVKVSACVWLLMLLLTGITAQGMDMYSYDLDSLVYMSTDVVEATLDKSDNFGERGVAHADITAVCKGNLTVGQKVPLVTLEFYAKPGSDPLRPYHTVALSGGDKVFLFLVKATSAPFYMDIPANSGIYRTTPSGVKLVESGHVIGFSQVCNPGPYLAGGLGQLRPEQCPTAGEFRNSMAKVVQNMDVLAAQFQAKPSPTDASWLMESIRTRPLRHPNDFLEMRGLDEIARLDCERLAQIHDNEGLAEALALDLRLDFSAPRTFAQGFGTEEGVEFLLQAAADGHRPLEARRRYAEMLEPAAVNYISGLAQKSGQWAGDYASKVATLAFDERGHEELCKALVDGAGALLSDGSGPEQLRQELDYTRHAINFFLNKSFRSQWKGADYSGAFAALRKLHDATDSESLKYEVELAIGAADQSEYKKLKSPCGPIVSIVRFRERPEQYQKPPGRSLLISSRWAVVEDTLVDRFTMIAEHEATGKKYTVDYPLGAGWWKKVHGRDDTETIPPDAPKGLYRIYCQFKQGETVVSTSHYLEARIVAIVN